MNRLRFKWIALLLVLVLILSQSIFVMALTQTPALSTDDVTVTNNAGIPDVVDVTNVAPGDIVKIYRDGIAVTPLASASVALGKADVSIKVTQLGNEAGTIYITLTSPGMTESSRTQVSYQKADTTIAPAIGNITIANYAGLPDVVNVSGLAGGDIVKVYGVPTAGTVLGLAITPNGAGGVTINVPQLGDAAGTAYVTVTTPGKLESSRTAISYSGADQSPMLFVSDVVVTNNVKIPDAVKVVNLSTGDIIKVYLAETGGSAVGSAVTLTGRTETTANVAQLGATSGNIFVSVKKVGKLESIRLSVPFGAEVQSDKLDAAAITVSNLSGVKDTITVTDLAPGDIIKAYAAPTGGMPLGSALTAIGKTTAVINVNQLGEEAGLVYVSVTQVGKNESERTDVVYKQEPSSTAAAVNDVLIKNNAGMGDSIKVSNLQEGDTVRVYKTLDAVTPLGTGIVLTGKEDVTVVVAQLGTGSGTVYIGVSNFGCLESTRIAVDYAAEIKSTQLDVNNITIVNNTRATDTVRVVGLSYGDLIRVYKSADAAASPIASMAVPFGKQEVIIYINQIGVESGTAYLTVTSAGKSESDKTSKAYAGEAVSTAPDPNKVTVTNREGIADTILITGLTAGDLVRVYKDIAATAPVAVSLVPLGKFETTVSLSQLGKTGGVIYLTVTSSGKLESSKVPITYAKVEQSGAPSVDDITITNNAGSPDTIKVKALKDGDRIRVYDAAGTVLLGTAAALSGKFEATVSIGQLGNGSGGVNVTITSIGLLESDKVLKVYAAEAPSTKADPSKMLVINDTSTDLVVVYGLQQGDVVKVYSLASGGVMLAKGVVASGQTHAIMVVKQLGENGGNIYITVTNVGKAESEAVAKAFDAQ